jgi:hypothetical protein
MKKTYSTPLVTSCDVVRVTELGFIPTIGPDRNTLYYERP